MIARAGAPVVAGVDGSAPSLAAVEIAAVEAARRHRRLHLVHALAGPPSGRAGHARAEALVAAAAARAGDYAPGLTVTTRIAAGPARDVLLSESQGAEMIVIGGRRRGPWPALLSGSIERVLLRRPGCPVLVVHADRSQARPDPVRHFS
ncbi:universal stress protein [Actinoplanes sp. NPDC049596]|uniref:universal stress protein n=1 Tax=unclassified Actinoplanes TaxID=2626549 RepID=UPI00344563FA